MNSEAHVAKNNLGPPYQLGSLTLLGSETFSAEAGDLRGKGSDLSHPGHERDYFLDRGIPGIPASSL